MPRGVPASAREAEKGAIACALAARLPGSRLLPRLIEPATELARRMPPFPSRLELPSPDKSSAARAEFRERAVLRVFERLGPDGASSAVRPVLERGKRRPSNRPFLSPSAHSPPSPAPTSTLSPPAFKPHTGCTPLCLAVAGQNRAFNFELCHVLGIHRGLLGEMRK